MTLLPKLLITLCLFASAVATSLVVEAGWTADSFKVPKRVALVIGNSQYQYLKPLKNPQADAKAIAKRLKKLGFTLIRPLRNSDVQGNLTEDEIITARNALLLSCNAKELV